jgi:hypothetical protein
MSSYRHTQVGTLVLALLGAMLLFTMVLTAVVGLQPVTTAMLAMLSVVMVLFSSLTVEVGEESLRLRFGPGPIGRRFELAAIREARTVRNPWYYGWGIRWFPGGWLFNISGFDAVEIVLRDGRIYRIGTDEPSKLLAAVQRATGRPD